MSHGIDRPPPNSLMLRAFYVTIHRFEPVEFSQALHLLPNAFVLPSLVTTGKQELLGCVPPSLWRYGLLPYCKSALRLEYIPPGQQHPLLQGTPAQLSGVGQGFVPQGYGPPPRISQLLFSRSSLQGTPDGLTLSQPGPPVQPQRQLRGAALRYLGAMEQKFTPPPFPILPPHCDRGRPAADAVRHLRPPLITRTSGVTGS